MERLDSRLVNLGLAVDRREAQALVMAGRVVVNNQRADQSAMQVSSDVVIRLKATRPYVSRGGSKLHGILEQLGDQVNLAGTTVLDIGASTGGFTDCCLRWGARLVYAVDVGTNQLDWRLRQHPKVRAFEQTDIRTARGSDWPNFDWVVADISFNSVARLASAIIQAAGSSHFGLLILVKPQFELSRAEVPSGGVVTDAGAQSAAVERALRAFEQLGMTEGTVLPAGLRGRSGNQEFFIFGRVTTHSPR